MIGRLCLMALVLASPVLAQDPASAALTAAGCGPDNIKFEVKVDERAQLTVRPDAGKAVVYVIGDEDVDRLVSHVGEVVTRIGLDGAWVGAKGFRSYAVYQVTPGEHRLCVKGQSIFKSANDITAAAITFNAEAGQTYYFSTTTPERHPETYSRVSVGQVDPARGQLYLASWGYSTAKQKK